MQSACRRCSGPASSSRPRSSGSCGRPRHAHAALHEACGAGGPASPDRVLPGVPRPRSGAAPRLQLAAGAAASGASASTSGRRDSNTRLNVLSMQQQQVELHQSQSTMQASPGHLEATFVSFEEGVFTVEGRLDVAAPASLVWEILADFEGCAEVFHNITSSAVECLPGSDDLLVTQASGVGDSPRRRPARRLEEGRWSFLTLARVRLPLPAEVSMELPRVLRRVRLLVRCRSERGAARAQLQPPAVRFHGGSGCQHDEEPPGIGARRSRPPHLAPVMSSGCFLAPSDRKCTPHPSCMRLSCLRRGDSRVTGR